MTTEKKMKRMLKFRDVLDGKAVIIDMYQQMEYIEDLDTLIEDVTKGYMYSGRLFALAEERYESKKIELEEYRGQLDGHYRDLEGPSPRPSVELIKSKIESDPEYVKRAKRLLKYKTLMDTLKFFNRGIQMKAEFLRSKIADRRKELDDLGMSPKTVRRPEGSRRS